MKKYKPLTLLILLAYYSVQAQNEITLKIFKLQNSNENSHSTYPDYIEDYKKNTINNFPQLSFTHLTKKETAWQISYCFLYYKSMYIKNGKSTKINSTLVGIGSSKYNSHTLKFGVGYRLDFKQFSSTISVNIPLQIQTTTVYKDSVSITQNGLVIDTRVSIRKGAPIYSTGLMINPNLFYNITKNIAIGAEFDFGFLFNYQNGKSSENNYEIYYGVKSSSVFSQSGVFKDYGFSFYPGLCLKYAFTPKTKPATLRIK